MAKQILIVVLVDNSPAIKKLFRRSTEKPGVELIVFDSAESSRPFLEKTRPDLLILSIILPEKDGFTLLKISENSLYMKTHLLLW